VGQGQAAQLTTTQPPTDEQHPQRALVFAALILHFVFFALTFLKQVSQRQAAQLATTQPPTNKQHPQCASFFTAAFIFHFVFFALVTFLKQVPSYHQHPHGAYVSPATIISDDVFLALTFLKQVSQRQAAQLAAAQPPTTQQEA
jgi:ABC-type Fe3+ transport system permease subunit